MLRMMYDTLIAQHRSIECPDSIIVLGHYSQITDSSPKVKRKKSKSALRVFEITELVLKIIHYLDEADLAILARVSKSLHRIVLPILYQHVCFHDDYRRLHRFLYSVEPNANVSLRSLLLSVYSYHFAQYLSPRIASQIHDEEMKLSHPCVRKDCREAKRLSQSLRTKSFLVPFGSRKGRRYDKVHESVAKPDSAPPPPCLFVETKPHLQTWNVPKSLVYGGAKGPFIKSIVITNIAIPDVYTRTIFESLVSLNVVVLDSCSLVSDETVCSLAKAARDNLMCVRFCNLANISDMGLHYLGQYCPNILELDCTDSLNVTVEGIRDILSMCPCLHSLILNRPAHRSHARMVLELQSALTDLGSNIRTLGIGGLPISDAEMARMIHQYPRVEHWMVSLSQLGTRRFSSIRAAIVRWFRVPITRHVVYEKRITLHLENQKRCTVLYHKRVNPYHPRDHQ
jgi:hypothetical protein